MEYVTRLTNHTGQILSAAGYVYATFIAIALLDKPSFIKTSHILLTTASYKA